MPRIRYIRFAEADLLELWLTIAEENLVAADESLDTIQAMVAILANQHDIDKARPELSNGLRSFPTRTPYIIFYLPEEDGLLIVRALHHARDFDAEYFS